MRKKLIAALSGVVGVTGMVLALEGDAQACGGCFGPPPSPTESPQVVTDHRMILSIGKDQSTLYDQIRYSGNPSSFAWVLPYKGDIKFGLSSDVVFETLNSLTTTSIVAPPRNCPPPPTCNRRGGAFGASASSDESARGSGAASDAAAPPPVQVVKQAVVGPYLMVQLKATNANALQDWLATNQFVVPPGEVQQVINNYVAEQFDFLALKLLPDKGVQDMRPVRVTTPGANAILPLRMVAAGTGAVVGITLWVIGEGRYEPQNYPSFSFKADDLAWDWNLQKSNYVDLRTEKTAVSNGRAWEIENSATVIRYSVETAVRRFNYVPPGQPDPDGGAPLDAQELSAQVDYLPEKNQAGTVTKTAVQVREEDLETLFHGVADASSRVTRIRADLAHAALNDDLIMTASQDQSQLPTVRQLTKELNQPLCPVFSADGCTQIGTAPRDEAAARANGESGESFSCSTANSPASPIWMGAGLGYLAIAIARARRRFRR